MAEKTEGVPEEEKAAAVRKKEKTAGKAVEDVAEVKKEGREEKENVSQIRKEEKGLKRKEKRPVFDLGNIFLLIVFYFSAFLSLIASFLLRNELNGLPELRFRLETQKKLEQSGFPPGSLEKLRRLSGVFLKEKDVVDLITKINQSSPAFEELSLSFESDEPVALGGQKHLPFVLKVSGPTDNVSLFLKRFLNAPLVINLVSLEAKTTDSFVGNAELVLKANLYVADDYN